MSANVHIDNLQKYLLLYSDLISTSNSIGLTDKAVNAENIFRSLLNLSFGWNLVNANAERHNQDSFDLVDRELKLYIQITANKNHSNKRKSAIGSFTKTYGRRKKSCFYILFISTKCSKAILKKEISGNLICECFDIPKLIRKIYFEVSDPSKLELINKLLQKQIDPVLLDFGKTENQYNGILIDQVIPLVKNGLYIRRQRLIKSVFEFIQTDNGLLIGNHGYGKSFLLEELQRLCRRQKVPCIIIRIDQLINGEDENIGRELKTGQQWLEAILKQSLPKSNKKGILIFDAFDTAKEAQLKQTILKQIQKSIKTLNPQWNILVSVRSFDAAKSQQLQQMFPLENMSNNISCRHFEISKLSIEELTEAIKDDKKISQIYKKANHELKELLRIPYFLILLEKSLKQPTNPNIKEIIQIETEEQLLSFYWNTTAKDTTAKDTFLEKLTTLLADRESLNIERSAILNDFNSEIFDDLCSKGIITENSVNGLRIAYTHNILLDYAISRYIIPSEKDELIHLMNKKQKLPFIFPQAFIYFYSRLWKRNPSVFWDHYYYIKEQDSPHFRLFHQTIMNYVAAVLYSTPKDLTPLFQQHQTKEAQGQIVNKLLEAFRFINKGILRKKDYDFLLFVSQRMHWVFLWELGQQISTGIRNLKEENIIESEQGKLLSEAACNYWEYVLDERMNNCSYKELIDRNSQFGIGNLCAIFNLRKTKVKKLITKTLLLLREEDFPIITFRNLANNITHLFTIDATFAIAIFKKMCYHKEDSKRETFFGSPVISLRSTRNQDYGTIFHMLESEFATWLELDPKSALPLGIELLNKYSTDQHWASYDKSRLPVKINNISGYFTLAGCYEDINDHEEHGMGSFGAHIFEWFTKLANDSEKATLYSLLNIFVQKAHTCNAWRRFIRLIAAHPQLLSVFGYELLINEIVLTSEHTTHEAGALINAVWPYLKMQQKRTIENIILRIKATGQYKKSNQYQLNTINRLLNCIPENKVVLAASRNFLKGHKPVKNKPSYRGITAADIVPRTVEEKMQYDGFNPADEKDVKAFAVLNSLKAFSDRIKTKNTPVTQKDLKAIFPILEQLFAQVKSAQWSNERIEFAHDNAINTAISLIVRSKLKLNETHLKLFKNAVLHYLSKPTYQKREYSNGTTATLIFHNQNPRQEAAHAAVSLLCIRSIDGLADKLIELVDDNDPFIRYEVLQGVTWYWHHQRSSFWKIILHRAQVEQDGLCLIGIIKAVFYTNIIKENTASVEKVVRNLLPTFLSLSGNKVSELWQSYVSILLHLKIYYNSATATKIISRNLGNNYMSNRLVITIIKILDPHDIQNNKEGYLERYGGLIALLENVVDNRFAILNNKGPAAENLKEDFEIIDLIVREIYFAITGGRGKNRNPNGLDIDRRGFYKSMKPVLSKVVENSSTLFTGFIVASTAYNFTQLLNFVFEFDPEYVLHLAFRIVNYASKAGFTYDQMTLTEIIKLTERVLTDYPTLLNKGENFNNLIAILDQFVNSGWTEALELTWRLKEAF